MSVANALTPKNFGAPASPAPWDGSAMMPTINTVAAEAELTHAHLDWGALNGLILDADGYELLDLYETFGVDGTPESLALGTAGTDVANMTREVKASIRRSLKGSPMTGVRILAGENFFAQYVGHATVKDAYKYFSSQRNPNRDALDDGFDHGGAVIERVDEEFAVRLANGTLETRPAIDPDEAIAIPLGTPYFKRYVSPPDTINDANQAPDPASKVFVSTDERPHGKGYDVHTESNVLPVALRPQVMKRLTL